MTRTHLIKGIKNEEAFKAMFENTSWDALDIMNTAFYVDYDVDKTKLILDTASKLEINYMDICQHIRKPLKNTV